MIVAATLSFGLPRFTGRAAAVAETGEKDLSSAAGVLWEFKPEGGDWNRVQVPAGGWRAQGYTCDAGTYRAMIPIPLEANGRVVRVAFAAVNFGAEVFAGKDAGHLTRVASHLNGWMPFVADLTPLVTPGSNLVLIVEVKGRRKYMVDGRYTVAEGATWYEGLAEGILRGITLQLLPPVHVEDVFVRTLVSPPLLHPQITVTNSSQKPVTATIAARLGSGNHSRVKYPEVPAASFELRPGEGRVVDLGAIEWKLGPESYWWPNVPYRPDYRAQLHFLDVELKLDGRIVHRCRQRFGFRQFVVNGDHYELNGIRCNLRGDNQQEANFRTDAYGIRPGFGPPTPGNPGWPQAVDNLLRLNFNVLRIHQIPGTPYMLEVCDEKGLMLVDESPLRGSEGREDFKAGHDAMLNLDRELVLRDRNHPAVVLWSAANEWAEPIPEAVKVIRAADDTRPIIADGGSFSGAVTNRDCVVMDHYVDGLGTLPLSGGYPRKDQPYGETEAVWFMDNTWQGFAWMGTSVRVRRLKGNADLRNYVLNNAWPGYVPGEGPETEILERSVKHMGGDMEIHAALADPWNHPLIQLMQKCYHPVAVCDPVFDLMNAGSNEKGEWPVVKPRLAAGSQVIRELAVFNDEFSGEQVTVRWQVRRETRTGPLHAKGEFRLTVPLGEFRRQKIEFVAPEQPGEIVLLLNSSKAGAERFSEDQLAFSVVTGFSGLVPDGDYQLISRRSGLAAQVGQDADRAGSLLLQVKPNGQPAQVWHLKNLGADDVMLINRKSGLILAIPGGSTDNGVALAQEAANGKPEQVWRLTVAGDGYYLLANRATGKVMDVSQNSADAGARIQQWDVTGGNNQRWRFK